MVKNNVTTFRSISNSRSVILIEKEDEKMKALKNDNIALIGVIPKAKIKNPQNSDDKPPKWFETWFSNFKKENDAHWAKQEEFNQNQLKFNENQTKFNQNQTKFNELIIKRLDSINGRIDNLVKKNNLKE